MKTKKLVKPKLNKFIRDYFNKDNKKGLDRKCLTLWQEIVKLRANYFCEFPGCQKTEHLNSHHIISRRCPHLRYDVENGMCLCSGHHTLTSDSAHKDIYFKDNIIAGGVRTKEFFDKLRLKSSVSYKVDRKLAFIELTQILEKMKRDNLLKPYRVKK